MEKVYDPEAIQGFQDFNCDIGEAIINQKHRAIQRKKRRGEPLKESDKITEADLKLLGKKLWRVIPKPPKEELRKMAKAERRERAARMAELAQLPEVVAEAGDGETGPDLVDVLMSKLPPPKFDSILEIDYSAFRPKD